jgi:competence protein ComEA
MRVALCRSRAENRAVRSRVFITVALLAVLGTCVSGNAQDRDSSDAPATSIKAPPPEARIDINRASLDELLKVPGMTRSWAGRIVRYRPYKTKADLLDQGIVTAEVYERIKDYVIAHRDER